MSAHVHGGVSASAMGNENGSVSASASGNARPAFRVSLCQKDVDRHIHDGGVPPLQTSQTS